MGYLVTIGYSTATRSCLAQGDAEIHAPDASSQGAGGWRPPSLGRTSTTPMSALWSLLDLVGNSQRVLGGCCKRPKYRNSGNFGLLYLKSELRFWVDAWSLQQKIRTKVISTLLGQRFVIRGGLLCSLSLRETFV